MFTIYYKKYLYENNHSNKKDGLAMIDLEELFKEINAFMNERCTKDNTTKEERIKSVAELVRNYNAKLDVSIDMPVTAYDFMDLAESASSRKNKMDYLQIALELEPDNLDAGLELAKLNAKDPHVYLETLNGLIAKGDKQMKDMGYLPKSIGDFWMIIDTRPYMRLCYERMKTCIDCGMIGKAIAEAERMLKLCENDNLGVRYKLMHLYVYQENEKAACKVYKKHGGKETQMLLPLAVLYYKLGNFDKAFEYLNELRKVNKDTKKFFSGIVHRNLYKYDCDGFPYVYELGVLSELMVDMTNNKYLFDSVPHFFKWANMKLKR